MLMFTCGILAQQCEAKAMALMASIASQINQSNEEERDDYLWTALNCIKECEKNRVPLEKNWRVVLVRFLKLSVFGVHNSVFRFHRG